MTPQEIHENFIDIKIHEMVLKRTNDKSNTYYKIQEKLLDMYSIQNKLALTENGFISFVMQSKMNY